MCMIQRLLPDGDMNLGTSSEETWPMVDGRLRAASSSAYPYRFITRALTDRSFRIFAQFRAVVIWAYDMDLITFYEFFSMNMPIFMPAHLSKYLFQQDHMFYHGRWDERQRDPTRPWMWPADVIDSPFNETSLDAVKVTVSFTDYFRLPHVQYFDSISHLIEMLHHTDYFDI